MDLIKSFSSIICIEKFALIKRTIKGCLMKFLQVGPIQLGVFIECKDNDARTYPYQGCEWSPNILIFKASLFKDDITR